MDYLLAHVIASVLNFAPAVTPLRPNNPRGVDETSTATSPATPAVWLRPPRNSQRKISNSHASASARGLTDPVQRLGVLGQPDQHLAELARLARRQVNHDGQLLSSRDQTAVDPHCDTTDG